MFIKLFSYYCVHERDAYAGRAKLI